MPNFFLLPGETIIHALFTHAPTVAAFFDIGNNPVVLTIVLSVLGWMLACVSAWLAYGIVINFIRQSNAVILTANHRITHAFANLKTLIRCWIKRLMPKRRDDGIVAQSEAQFDKIDFAVLRTAAMQGPANTTSAPELAENFGLRPAQFQKSLNKLHHSKMVDVAVGSTDGFDNYRLTDYGAAYLSTWQRQRAEAS